MMLRKSGKCVDVGSVMSRAPGTTLARDPEAELTI